MTTAERQARLEQLAVLLADIEGALDRLNERKDEVKGELSKLRGSRDEVTTPEGVEVKFSKNTKRNTQDDELEDWLADQPEETRETFTRLDTRKSAFNAAVKAGQMSKDERARFEVVSYGTPRVKVTDNRPAEAAHRPALELLRDVS
jgi:chromosome segregation ATPase